MNIYIPALKSQFSLPICTVSSTTSHCPEEVGVDLDHFLDSLRGNPGPRSGTGIHGNNHTVLKLERQCRSPVGKLNFYSILARCKLLQ